MSDIFLVGLIAALSGLIGAGIAGIVTFKVTKRQTDAQAAALNRQLQYQTEQARIDRLVQARKGSIIPLGEAVARIYGRLEFVSAALGEVDSGPTPQEYLDQVEVSGQRLLPDLEELTIQKGQISDGNLAGLVEEFERAVAAAGASSVFSGGVGPQRWRSMAAALPEVRPILLAVNRRIEELLSGAELE